MMSTREALTFLSVCTGLLSHEVSVRFQDSEAAVSLIYTVTTTVVRCNVRTERGLQEARAHRLIHMSSKARSSWRRYS